MTPYISLCPGIPLDHHHPVGERSLRLNYCEALTTWGSVQVLLASHPTRRDRKREHPRSHSGNTHTFGVVSGQSSGRGHATSR